MSESEAKFRVSRRFFLKTGLAAGLAGSLAPALARQAFFSRTTTATSTDPIQDIGDDLNPSGFIGDHPSHIHEILWHKADYLAAKGGVPAPGETTDVVIVGGGLSGLAAADRLRDLKPIVLEQNRAFGGNARGESWGSLTYSIGSAYITKPEENSSLAHLLTELGLTSKLRSETALEEGVLLSGEHSGFKGPFWTGETDPEHAADIKRIYETLVKFGEESYPAIPTPADAPPEAAARLRELDGQSFSDWARANLSPIPSQVAELLAEYCWDSMGGTPEELSAAQVLNFLTADLAGGAQALPGGNSALAQALLARIESAVPASNLRTGVLTVDVTARDGGVVVAYEGPDGVLRSIKARTCIVTTPKFVARAIVSGLPRAQFSAMGRLHYRAFLVANVLLEGDLPAEHFGAFRLTGQVPAGDPSRDERPYTSVVFGAWAGGGKLGRSSLTLYRGFPFDKGRHELSPEAAFAQMRSRFEASIPALLEALQVSPSRVKGLRITRWGHALPLAATGLIADGTLEQAARPLGGRIFFAQQDNWANPCVESAITAAIGAAESARRSG